MGMNEELEHEDVSDGDLEVTAKIAAAHLREMPDYYTRLKAMEHRAELGLAPNPPWSDKLLKRYASAIKERWGEWAVPAQKEYGCGYYGCVFPTNKESYVVKITTDETEAKLIATFLHPDFEVPSGIVQYEDMFVVSEKRLKRHVFFILRQSADKVGNVPLTSMYTKLLYAFKNHAALLRQILKRNSALIPSEAQFIAARNYKLTWDVDNYGLLRVPKWAKGKDAVAYHFAACKQLAEEMYQTEALYSVGAALDSLLDQDIVLADVHMGNIGYDSGGEIIITDPGHPVFLKYHPTIDVPLIEVK